MISFFTHGSKSHILNQDCFCGSSKDKETVNKGRKKKRDSEGQTEGTRTYCYSTYLEKWKVKFHFIGWTVQKAINLKLKPLESAWTYGRHQKGAMK